MFWGDILVLVSIRISAGSRIFGNNNLCDILERDVPQNKNMVGYMVILYVTHLSFAIAEGAKYPKNKA
jgi:hypothetical protein